MERKKRKETLIDDDTPQDWRNTGGPHKHCGSSPQHVNRGGILRQVPRSELKYILDKFVPLKVAEIKELELKETLVLRSAGGGWYDVFNIGVDPEKKLNDKRMRKEAAEELINTINGPEAD